MVNLVIRCLWKSGQGPVLILATLFKRVSCGNSPFPSLLDHDDRVGGQKFRRKGRGPFRAPILRGGQRGSGGPGPRARFDDEDGDVAMTDSSSQDGSSQHRLCVLQHFIQIPHGKKYDKDWLITGLQNICSVPFTPVHFHTEGNRAQFYVDDSTTASALSRVSRKITDKDGYKDCLNASYASLNLIDLVSHNIDVTLNTKNSMRAVTKIIEENIPELVCLNLSNNKLFRLEYLSELVSKVPNLKILNLSHNELKTERELDKIKGLKLVELWLERNPLCDYFKDQTVYISAVRERFPRLLKLDGQDLPPPIVFDVEDTPAALPPCKPSYFCSEEIKSAILGFLQQYYSVYDSGDRQPLLDAYHDGAAFSLSVPFTMHNPSRCSLGDYHKDTRNLKKIKDPTSRFRLLKHTRLNVVAFLNELPKTQHDIASLNVDVNTFTNTLLSFTVSGVFKEVEGKSRDSVRAFSRVFITVPAGGTSLCIVNDELFVRNATTEEIRRAFVAPAPTPSSSPVPTLSAPQQEMLTNFSLKSGMNLEWSQKCLQDNEWDYIRAGRVFTDLKVDYSNRSRCRSLS
uniref:NTF2 domain-containing protein n=1 Tax=Esox lucius TaxID=8010 RepID=A0A3P8YHH7_ESOLU